MPVVKGTKTIYADFTKSKIKRTILKIDRYNPAARRQNAAEVKKTLTIQDDHFSQQI